MANIPNYGGFHVTEQPAGGAFQPWPMEIPKVPESGVGKALEKASAKMDAFTQKLIEDQDNARVTEAMTALRKKAIDLDSGENGYSQLLGKNALTPDEDGNSIVQRYYGALDDFSNQLSESMTPSQLRKFNEQRQGVMTSFYGGVSQHMATQGVRYQDNAAMMAIENAAESGAVYARKPDQMAASETVIGEQIERRASLNGWTTEQAAVEKRKAISGLQLNAINQLLAEAEEDPSSDAAFLARGILDANGKKMLGSDVVKASRLIDGYLRKAEMYKQVESIRSMDDNLGKMSDDPFTIAYSDGEPKEADIREITMSAYSNVVIPSTDNLQNRADTSDPDRAKWRYGVSNISVPDAMEAAKRLGIEVKDEKTFAKMLTEDKTTNMRLGQEHLYSLISSYGGDMQKAFAAYIGGKDVLDNAIKEAEYEKEPAAWIYNLPAKVQERTEKWMKAWNKRDANRVGSGSEEALQAFRPDKLGSERKWMTAEQIREKILRTSPRAQRDPEFLEDATTRALTDQSRRQSSYKQERANLMADITDRLFKSDGDISDISPQLISQLTPTEFAAVKALGKKISIRDNSTDMQTWGTYMTDDAAMLSLTGDGVRAMRGLFSEGDYRSFMYKWVSLKTKAGQSVDAALKREYELAIGQIPAEFVNVPQGPVDRALSAYMDGYAKLKSKHPEQAKIILSRWMSGIARAGALKGEKITGVAIDNYVQSHSHDMVRIDPLFGFDRDTPVFALKVGDMTKYKGATDAYYVLQQITANSLNLKDRKPTESEMQSMLTDLYVSKDLPVNLVGVHFAGEVLDEIQNAAKKSTGQPLSGARLVRAYLENRLSAWEPEDPNEGLSQQSLVMQGADEALTPYSGG